MKLWVLAIISVIFIPQSLWATDGHSQCQSHPAVRGPCYWVRGISGPTADGRSVAEVVKGSSKFPVTFDDDWKLPASFEAAIDTMEDVFTADIAGEFLLCPLPPKKIHETLERNMVCVQEARHLQVLKHDDAEDNRKLCAFEQKLGIHCK